jgi:ribosomal protein S12 methylthiotransferase accessory factor
MTMIGKQQERIGCLGTGRLYEAVQSRLELEYQLVRIESIEDLTRLAPECSMIVYCDDQWHSHTQREITEQCLQLGIPWLRAYCEFGTGIIGPCFNPDEAGCVACVELRRRAAMRDATDFILLCQQDETVGIGLSKSIGTGSSKSVGTGSAQGTIPTALVREQPWLTARSLEVLTQLVVQEVSTYFQTPNLAQTRRAMLYVDLDTLHCQRHRFLPEPECPVCGSMLPDTPEGATIMLQSRPKLSPSTYRIRSLKAHAKEIFETYVDMKTGLVPALVKDPNYSIAMTTAWIGISDGREGYAQMSGTGRTLSYEQSQLAAIAEALERYGGQRPKTRRTTVQASYRELGEQAMDPTTLGLHTAEQYALPGFRYIAYHPDLVCHWVWGYSFQRKQPILVPKHVGFYGVLRLGAQTAAATVGTGAVGIVPCADPVPCADLVPTGVPEVPDAPFVYEISNGCALGNCLEEAIFYGILEVAERDAFLMTWYAQLSVPRLDPRSATNPEVALMLENIEQASGYTIYVFNTTLDHGVPCCWVMAVDEQDRDGMPKALCAAGSHPNPELAVLNALQELEMMVKRPFNDPNDLQASREKALEMLFDPLAVKEMEHHSLLYHLPEAFERLSFLYASPQTPQTFQEAFSAFYSHQPTLDLCDDLTALINHYLARGIDIIVVDQTAPEHAAQDFRCVKVIMPGMLPMTFGQQHRRNTGFQRLYHLPAQLGYRAGPLTDADINPHPHPFP